MPLLLLLACTGAPVDTVDPADTALPDTTDTPCGTRPVVDLDQPDAGFLFTGASPTVFDMCIDLDDASIAALTTEPKSYTPATLTFGGETWTVGLHLKGSESGSFRTLDEKASFKIKLSEYDPEQRFYGRKRLTLNSMIQDGSMLSEHVSYFLFDAAGVPSPLHGYTNVYVNGELFGLYGVAETMDEELLNRLFPDTSDGTLYEGGYGADLYNGRTDEFTVQESPDATDTSDLDALIAAVEAAEGGDVYGMLGTWFERDALLAMWAVELVTSGQDAYTTAGNNYLLYHATPDARWTMLPWGADQAFWRYDSAPVIDVRGALEGRLGELCRADAACSDALDDAIRQALTTWEDADVPAYAASTAAAIEDDCFADPRSSWGSYGCLTAQEETLAWIAARPDIVRGQLEAAR